MALTHFHEKWNKIYTHLTPWLLSLYLASHPSVPDISTGRSGWWYSLTGGRDCLLQHEGLGRQRCIHFLTALCFCGKKTWYSKIMVKVEAKRRSPVNKWTNQSHHRQSQEWTLMLNFYPNTDEKPYKGNGLSHNSYWSLYVNRFISTTSVQTQYDDEEHVIWWKALEKASKWTLNWNCFVKLLFWRSRMNFHASCYVMHTDISVALLYAMMNSLPAFSTDCPE